MKLVIQIPCFNEEGNLRQTLQDLPKSIKGIESIETLVIDDGSIDGTVRIAKEFGVDHILELKQNRGLATAFHLGIRKALNVQADIVVNTDADNQYNAKDIPKLIKPIKDGTSDLVIGCRPIRNHPEFSLLKKLLQYLGSWVLRKISKTNIPDAASGFRAYSRETCLRLIVHSRFSHCMESLIQAGNSGMSVAWIDIRINPSTRPSRLFKSTWQYLRKSGETIIAISSLYAPWRFYSTLASICFLPAFALGIRFVYLDLSGRREPGTYLPSLILVSILSISGLFILALGIFGELLKTHRRLNEEILYELRSRSLSQKEKTSVEIESKEEIV